MSSIAVIYSKALYGIAEEQRAKISQDLMDFLSIVTVSKDLQKALNSPLFDANTREGITKEIARELKLQQISERFLCLLALKNRMSFLNEISREFNSLCDKESGLIKGFLYTAIPLSLGEIEEIAKAIGKKIDRRVELIAEIDETLLGGFVAQVDGKTFDSSLKTQFQRLQEACIV